MSEGNEKAFADLFHRYRNKIYTIAFKLTASEENSEEIVQDVFMKVWKKRSSLEGVDNFDPWLFILARNTIYSFLRSKAAREIHAPLTEEELLGVADDADLRIKEKEFQQFLKQAVDRLPPQQKQVYQLSKDAQLSYAEIGSQLDIAPETARKHLQYALKSIRAYLLVHMDLGILLIILWKTS